MSEQPQVQPAEGFKPLAEWGEIEALSSEELEAWKRSPVTRLESRVIATIARLQARVEEAKRAMKKPGWENHLEMRRYKALAEQRMEALEIAAGSAHGLAFLHPDCPGHSKEFMDCQHPICADARVAIDAVPDEAREKEGR